MEDRTKNNAFMEKLSPMMRQYMETKAEYPDCILFYRLGDFYEMFFEDAIVASKELEITLTGKDCGLKERAPMCGVPYHAVDAYLGKLVQKGYKVAIGEQVEDPKLAKGLVKREVVRVVTPGTILSSQTLDEERNNYLMCIVYIDKLFGIAIADVSTGDFRVTEVKEGQMLLDEIYKFTPSEVLCNEAFYMSGISLDSLKEELFFSVSSLENCYFLDESCKKILLDHFHASKMESLGLEEFEVGSISAGALMQYLYQTQKNDLVHITEIRPYRPGRFMVLDTAARRNLELTETIREKKKRGSLLWVLDQTKTAMGARLLRNCLEQPLVDKNAILLRQAAVKELYENYMEREELREYLDPVYDLERLIGRISYNTATPRDLIAFQSSLKMIPPIKQVASGWKAPLLQQLEEEMDGLEDVCELIGRAIEENPPLTVREGGIIREGFSEEADLLRRSKTEGKQWLSQMEAREREQTGIKTLKIKYNKVFGYYLEVSNSFKNMVPEHYVRKQTLSNAERYSTPELKELEDQILGAEEKLCALEYELFCQVRNAIAKEIIRIQRTARAVAMLDVLAALGTVAQKNHYVKPEINCRGVIEIKGGRHPVVELMIPNDLFVKNDVLLDNAGNRVAIITGPNMAGKSTYMRQVALITLMAQIGSFVPADAANIGICDRIFTRVGASDDLASGQSTFMVEMTEVSNILRNATRQSLIILDEIGRGTSTFDGMSIAWAVVEHIADPKILGAKTLFATHYHELTELEGTLPGVNNYCIAVKEQGDDILFLRKIVRGGADKSYGIQVARLAGVPEKVLLRAKELVEELSDADIATRAREVAQMAANRSLPRKRIQKPDEVDSNQLSLFDVIGDDKIIEEIREMDLTRMTPIDALNTLYQLQIKVKNRI